jgi:hypothetical protein
MAETLVSRVPATAGTPSTATFGWWERFGLGAAGGWRVAPCWVLKEQPVGCLSEGRRLHWCPVGCGWGWSARHGLVSHTGSWSPVLVGVGLLVWGVVGCGLVVC